MSTSFIMTLDSDDDSPAPPPAQSSSESHLNRSAIPAAKGKGKRKLTRKEQLKLSLKTTKASKKNQNQKRKPVNNISDNEDNSQDDGQEDAMGAPASGDEAGEVVIAEDFHFDGLGGGFVGEKRQQVWDSGQQYITTRPNAIPRVTVDEIIARRAPERLAKAKMVADRKKLTKEDEDEDEEIDLEAEMLNDLENGEDSADDEDDVEEDGSESEEEDVLKVDEDEADWLNLDGPDSGDEEDTTLAEKEDSDEEEVESEDETQDDASDVEAATGFAALASVEADMSAAEDSSEDEKKDLPVVSTKKANDEGGLSAAELAASKAYFTSHTNTLSSSTNTFSTLPGCTLSRQLLLALSSLNLLTPTPIQKECIPVTMLGKDIVASSRTGSGKTVAFWVGVIERLLHRDRRNSATRVVVMTPTRELAVQVHGVGMALARYTDVQFCLCVGGLSLKVQEAELKLRPDVVVSTPGRLIDHVRNTPCFTMDKVEILVLDEADRMLEEGFRAELEEIITAAPRSRQTLLFSATVTESISQLSRLSMNKPVRVKIDEMGATASGLVQEFLRVRGDKPGEAIERGFRSGERSREALLVALCTKSFSSGRTIIFFRSKAQAHRMKIVFSLFGEGLERSDELHGDLTQDARLNSLRRFREGECSFLLATDLASRGLDIKGIENVINYEMPRSIEIYLHRVGRTARAGRKGRALTLVGESDRKLVKLAMKHAPPETIKQRVIPPEVINEVSLALQELENEVKGVQREEKEEKEFRRGDMELTKGRNLIEHEMEIKARPARTWFQTSSEKAAAKTVGLAEHNGKFTEKNKNGKRPAEDSAPERDSKTPKRTPLSGLSRKEKRRKMAAADEREDRESGVRGEVEASIRSAKKASRPGKLTFAKPDHVPGTQPKKKKKGGKSTFDRELGQAGKAEKEKKMRPSPIKRKQAGGSAGKSNQGGGAAGKRGSKPGKMS